MEKEELLFILVFSTIPLDGIQGILFPLRTSSSLMVTDRTPPNYQAQVSHSESAL